MISSRKLGVIGVGNMGEALIRGALKAGVIQRSRVVASRRTGDALQRLQEELGIATTTDNLALLRDCDVVLVCVKPQGFKELMAATRGGWRPDQLVITICAGITTRAVEDGLGLDLPVIRVMPNTPALVGEGMSPYCRGRFADESHALMTAELFSSVGKTVHVPEDLMDPITATSGSGPAYVFYLVEAMQKAAEKLGLPEHLARALVRQTVLGAAKLLIEAHEGPAELRRRVTSPGGTTAAAIGRLEEGNYSGLVAEALQAACNRAKELGERTP